MKFVSCLVTSVSAYKQGGTYLNVKVIPSVDNIPLAQKLSENKNKPELIIFGEIKNIIFLSSCNRRTIVLFLFNGSWNNAFSTSPDFSTINHNMIAKLVFLYLSTFLDIKLSSLYFS